MSRTWKSVVELSLEWITDPRWRGVVRPYTADEVINLRGNLHIEQTLACKGAWKFWQLLMDEPYVKSLGALTGGQAVQSVTAGLKAIYASGWQVAADANDDGETYPDQSLYSVSSVPLLVRRINKALLREDQKQRAAGGGNVDWIVPIVADAEAGFGGVLNGFELMKHMIEAGAACVHFEDQLSSEKKCGHLSGKVVIPTNVAIEKLVAARLAADVLGVPTVIMARTDANSATLLANDIDDRDKPFIHGERTHDGYFRFKGGINAAIARGVAYAPYSDMLWCETSTPNIEEARQFAEAVLAKHPNKFLAYNCSPSFNWKKHLDGKTIKRFMVELAAMGYRFFFVTLAGFHAMNAAMFELAEGFARRDMTAYVDLQQKEFELEKRGYRAVKHQEFVGTGYFDEVKKTVSGDSETLAMDGSTESEQF